MSSVEPEKNTPRLTVGDLVAGKYRVERILGQGGMGIVVSAIHEELGQKVAIKVLRPELAGAADTLERFLREARAAARLESDHVARVFDVGKLGDDCAFMVMEYLEGQDLEQLLASSGRLDLQMTADYLLEAIEAVAHAHAIGMVHRDLKPSNLFLSEKAGGAQRIKVLDFGISKTETALGAGGQGSTLTSPGALLGSPAYMSPEQIRSSKTVDQRADIWSLGVILYELLTGVSPFAADSVGETFARVLDAKPEPIQHLRADLPAAMVAVVDKCLQSNRDKRYSNVAELAEALAPFASSRAQELPLRIARVLGLASSTRASFRSIVPIEPTASVSDSAATMAATGDHRGAGQTVSSWSESNAVAKRPKRGIWLVSATAAAALVGIGVFFVFGQSPPPVPSSNTKTNTVAASPQPLQESPQVAPAEEPKPSATPAAAIDPAPSATTLPSAFGPKGVGKLGEPSPSASTTKKNPGTPGKTKYPNSLLDGRD